ncbi:hypothetical protein [Aporhodopirellula aestuarii]|uniref:Transmembrane protein n=1 Tax=Aporhodopirellula aestuarii TaxID=2950107 RepID=A0ABT0TY63_9BACT|nr:hypothetical protein [Aporhodopirellula aestuarii]MCM2369324.1 hypothetical protein [Aporhodopirellula aestuarii]
MPSEPIPADDLPKKDPPVRVPGSDRPPLSPTSDNGRFVTGAGGQSETMSESGLGRSPESAPDAVFDDAEPSPTDLDPSADDTEESEAGGEDRSEEEYSFDDIAVDEMVRDLELEAEVESLDVFDEQPIGASEDDFALIGVRNLEWRLSVIRVAAHRSADAIAASQLVEPSDDKEERLAQIVLSTYRLIDPRFRGSYFQQVRVGRLMPLVLQQAACIDYTPSTVQTRRRIARQNHVRLFGHPFPVQNGSRARKKKRRRHWQEDTLSGRAEALEVLAELRARSTTAIVRRWLHDTRFLAGMIFVIASTTIGLGLFAARRNLTGPRPLIDQAVGSAGGETMVASMADAQTPSVLSASDDEDDFLPVEPMESEALELTDYAMPHAEDLSPEITNPGMTTDELMASLAEAANESTIVLPEVATFSHELPEVAPITDIAMPSTELPKRTAEDSYDPFAEPGETVAAALEMSGVPKPSGGRPRDRMPESPSPKLPKHSPADVAAAASELWAETESAARRFTQSSIADLIEQWELVAEIAGPDSLESAAARHLILQAAWLEQPLSSIVAFLRKADAGQAIRFADVSLMDSDLKNTANLDVDEIKVMLESWRSSLRRVVASNDIERMLEQANVLLDRIVVSDQLVASKRSDVLLSFRTDVERLVKIVSDKETLAETNYLLTAIDSLPNATEWARLQAADKPSGLLGSIYCLHQRRWEEGIVWLGQSSNLVVAACAKAECELRQSGDPVDGHAEWIALAERWVKVAQRLEGREAAAIRLHALEILGTATTTLEKRKELIALLPKYLQIELPEN